MKSIVFILLLCSIYYTHTLNKEIKKSNLKKYLNENELEYMSNNLVEPNGYMLLNKNDKIINKYRNKELPYQSEFQIVRNTIAFSEKKIKPFIMNKRQETPVYGSNNSIDYLK